MMMKKKMSLPTVSLIAVRVNNFKTILLVLDFLEYIRSQELQMC